MDRNPPANAGDTGLIPGLGRFHMLWSNPACVCLELVLCNKKSHCNEKPSHCNEEQPSILTAGESPLCNNEDPVQPKISILKNNKIIIHMSNEWLLPRH